MYIVAHVEIPRAPQPKPPGARVRPQRLPLYGLLVCWSSCLLVLLSCSHALVLARLAHCPVQILIALATGFVCVLVRALDQKTDIHAINKVIFYILLPSAVLLALGLNTNLRDGDVWRFVGGFLLLRALCLIAVWVFHGLVRRQSLAYVCIQWMVTCWVSTVVLGIPLLIATLGPQYGSLGAVAAISSFIFQVRSHRSSIPVVAPADSHNSLTHSLRPPPPPISSSFP
jgi:hypothetical protein